MFRLEITNYESITHTKIEVEGFTTLIGRNFLGKSSVLRAINAALTNKEGTEFISWGQTFCEVHLIFPDLDILWHKEDGNNFYKINGKEYTKIGKGEPPQEILDAGFRPIVVGDQKINLNFATQFFPLFLVNKRDSKSADILTSVYGLDRIYKAIDLCNKEQRANSDLLRLREKDLKITEGSLEKFKTFPEIIQRIPGLKIKRKELGDQESEIQNVKQWDESLKVLIKENSRLKPISGVKLPVADPISKDISQYLIAVRYKADMDTLLTFLKKIKPAQDLVIPDKYIPEIKESFGGYQKLLIWSSSYRKLSEEVARLTGIQGVSLPVAEIDIVNTPKLHQRLINWATSYKKLSEEVNRLTEIQKVTIPVVSIDVQDIPKIQLWFDQVKSLSTEARNLKSSYDEVVAEIAVVTLEIDSFDICPLCGVKRG